MTTMMINNMNSDDERASHVPVPIDKTINFEKHQNYVDRYFTKKFQINMSGEYNDICVLIHSNRLCMITLAPSHPIIRNDMKISNIDFQVSKNVNRLNNKTSGKRKRNAQLLQDQARICSIECEDGTSYPISTPIPGKLIEINERLRSDMQILRCDYSTNYFQECYIAIIMPSKHDAPIEELTRNLLSSNDYEKSLLERNV